jgi:hypothetical protein
VTGLRGDGQRISPSGRWRLAFLEDAVPVEFGLWRIDGDLRKVPFAKLGDESRLEDILERDVSILGLDVMVRESEQRMQAA